MWAKDVLILAKARASYLCFVHDLFQSSYQLNHIRLASLPSRNTQSQAASWEGPTEAVITQQIAANVTALP